MKNWVRIICILGIIVFYIISINIFANLISVSSENYEISKTIMGGSIVEINVGTSVGISVTRAPKFYGRIHENNGNSYLNLFYICNLPIKIKNYNFIWFHLIFLISLILFIILIFTKQKVYKEENLNLEYEKLGENLI